MKNIRVYSVYFAVIVAICLVLGSGVFFYVRYERNRHFGELMLKAETAYHQYDYDVAVTTASGAVSFASSGEQADVAKYYIASSLFNRRNNGDMTASISLFKSIIADGAADTRTKGLAYLRLGLLYNPPAGSAASKKLVFNAAPYAAYLADAHGDLLEASLALLEKSNQLYPSAAANYAIAASQAMKIYTQGIDTKNPSQQQAAQEIESVVAKGDGLLGVGSSTLAQLPQLYMLRAFAQGIASYYLSSVSPQMVDSSYEQALSFMSASSSTIPYLRQTDVMLNLTYAASLIEREPGVQDAKIVALLTDFVNGSSAFPGLSQSVLAIHAYKPGTPILDAIPKLAKLSPPFAAYLTQIGWKK